MMEVSDHIETIPLICRANQWTDFYRIETSVIKELNENNALTKKYGECRQGHICVAPHPRRFLNLLVKHDKAF